MPRGDRLRNAALLVLSLAASIGLAELAVRLFVPVRDVGPPFTVHDPVLGKRLKAGFSAERVTPEFTMRLSTNSLGFRGAEPRAFPRRPILFLGDSFTLGYGVSDGEEYPARVAAELRRRHGDAAPPVVNAGIGDSGNGYWVKLLRARGEEMQPRLVVMQVYENDFFDNINEKLFLLEPDGALHELAVPPPGTMRRLQQLVDAVPGLSHSYLIGLLRQARTAAPRAPEAAAARVPNDLLTLRIVEQALLACKARNWPALGLLVGLSHEREAAMRALFAGHGVPVVTIPAKNERPELYYRVDGHWNAAGHAHAAEQVLGAMGDAVARRAAR